MPSVAILSNRRSWALPKPSYTRRPSWERIGRRGRPAVLIGWVQIGVGASVLLSVLLIWGRLPGLSESNALNHMGLSWSSFLLRRFLVALRSIAGSLAAGFVILPLLSAKGALVGTALLSATLGLVLHAIIRRRGAGRGPDGPETFPRGPGTAGPGPGPG